ncbi:MAG: four helix bundle protein [Anaerolineae bacterium]|nr:four helix bundle protein [Anaerolineae bacterium]
MGYPFEQLRVWHSATEMIKAVYVLCDRMRKREQYGGLADQIRRAAVSVALNIAEGKGSGSDSEFRRFLRISLRSQNEVVAGVKIAISLGYFGEDGANEVFQKCDETGKGINALISTLTRAIQKARKKQPTAKG